MEQKEIWIVAAKRTPMGRFQGMLSEYSSPQLGAMAIKAAVEEHPEFAGLINEVYMGCVLPAGTGQAPARQAALGGGLDETVGCTTVNKVCGSGMKSVMLAHDLIRAGSANCVLAGGMESMTNAPYLLKEARSGMRMGHKSSYDHMFLDGLQDAYQGELMGVFGQQIADKLEFTRQNMDEWASLSVGRAMQAQQQKLFDDEMVSVSLRNGEVLDYDEQPPSIKPEKIPQLKPAFAKDGSITAANSSAISDGAAALVVMDGQLAQQKGLKPLAIIKGHATHARQPSEFTIAPVHAIEHLLSQLDWDIDEVDLWEINEAFAVVTQIAVKQLGLDSEKVNIKGGACALGHPIGASGARIIVTLIHSLRQLQKLSGDSSSNEKRVMKGIASLCIGGGEATAIGIEIPL
ncbi:acetyl-CoA C-acyltransferase [Vibrio sp. OCN044]|uniref:Acetyl-CoA C-acyltransferase n=1 Tax=Vibrio tetraodonis subsp. pristinus TaxID=2695891 RepID=A0A6L8LW96_9VIBR|nr:acetyl-CoA C-acyltransferase [Vibrio tetraodonis]MYM60388.1 acetyl-CoA C-acyltransferase [Vibrio tetraodonis subsp. pristinus]